MYIINRDKNEIASVDKKTFSELKFSERYHLQEWIAKKPEVLGEELLIIQKEFAGFDDTNERLDLLALDKKGNLVVIENKLDDTGRNVTWQALKYASYCSSLSKTEVVQLFQDYLESSKNAQKEICEFLCEEEFSEVQLNLGKLRIIFVAANFRKEVTSTVMWLVNEYDMDIRCIKVAPYKLREIELLDVEQIIPVKDAEEYIIKIAKKKQEEHQVDKNKSTLAIIRNEFWHEMLINLNEKTTLYKNVNPSNDTWLGCGIGVTGVIISVVVTKKHIRVEFYFNNKQEINKDVFDKLLDKRGAIEQKIGAKLEWERLDEKKASIIYARISDVHVESRCDWPKMLEFIVENVLNLESLIDVVKEAVAEVTLNKK